MSLLDDARKTLESAGYSTLSSPSTDLFYFEDSSLLGIVWHAPSVPALLDGWRSRQDSFLNERDRSLRRANEKSWNVYCVALTEDEPTPENLLRLAQIEDDFSGTRKIARAGVRAPSQLTRALLPLLPIQNRLSLSGTDSIERLQARLSSIDEQLARTLLMPAKAETVAQLILEKHEDS
jgi:hypothetical protein